MEKLEFEVLLKMQTEGENRYHFKLFESPAVYSNIEELIKYVFQHKTESIGVRCSVICVKDGACCLSSEGYLGILAKHIGIQVENVELNSSKNYQTRRYGYIGKVSSIREMLNTIFECVRQVCRIDISQRLAETCKKIRDSIGIYRYSSNIVGAAQDYSDGIEKIICTEQDIHGGFDLFLLLYLPIDEYEKLANLDNYFPLQIESVSLVLSEEEKLRRLLDETKKRHEEEKEKLKQAYEERIAEHEERIAEYEKRIAEYEKRIAEYEEKIAELQAELNRVLQENIKFRKAEKLYVELTSSSWNIISWNIIKETSQKGEKDFAHSTDVILPTKHKRQERAEIERPQNKESTLTHREQENVKEENEREQDEKNALPYEAIVNDDKDCDEKDSMDR